MFSNFFGVHFLGFQNLWVLIISCYANFVGIKIVGVQICGHSKFKDT